MQGVTRKQSAEALEALDKATEAVRAHFPKLLYGDIYISKTLPGSHRGTVAQYVPATDVVYLSTKARGTVGDVRALCHEFGHRYQHRFWDDRSQWEAFRDLSLEHRLPVFETFDRKRRERVADEILDVVHARRESRADPPSSPEKNLWIKHLFKTRRQDELWQLTQNALAGGPAEERALRQALAEPPSGDVRIEVGVEATKPILVTPYGGTNPSENFCEAFSFYVLGMPLPEPIQVIMKDLR
jgi:hypothetical protein